MQLSFIDEYLHYNLNKSVNSRHPYLAPKSRGKYLPVSMKSSQIFLLIFLIRLRIFPSNLNFAEFLNHKFTYALIWMLLEKIISFPYFVLCNLLNQSNSFSNYYKPNPVMTYYYFVYNCISFVSILHINIAVSFISQLSL